MNILLKSLLSRIIGFQIACLLFTGFSTVVGSEAAVEITSQGAYCRCLLKFTVCRSKKDLEGLKKLREEVIRLEGNSTAAMRPSYAKLLTVINQVGSALFEKVVEDILNMIGGLVVIAQQHPLNREECQTLLRAFELAAHPNYPHHEEIMLLKRAYDRANANRDRQGLASVSQNNRGGTLPQVVLENNHLQNNNKPLCVQKHNNAAIVSPAVKGLEELPALHKAAKVNNIDDLPSILRGGADINGRDREGNTPLHWAARNGHWKFVARLLLFNADRDLVNEKKETALQLAQESGYGQAVRILKGDTIVKNESHDNCPICSDDLDAEGHALVRISSNCLCMIHKACRDQHTKSKYGKSCPLCQQPIVDPAQAKTAIRQERINVELAPNSRTVAPPVPARQVVALNESQRAASHHSSVVTMVTPEVQRIAQVSRPINTPSQNRSIGLSLDQDMQLLVAASSGYVEGVCSLLNQGANVNFSDSEGVTPLIAATIGGYCKIIEELLYRYSATADLVDKNGRTALYWAAARGNRTIVRLLTAGRANDLRGKGMTPDEVNRMIYKSISIRALDHSSPFSIAATNKHLSVAQFLADWINQEEELQKRIEEERRKQLRELAERQERHRIIEERRREREQEEVHKQQLLESEQKAIARALARKAQEQEDQQLKRHLDEERRREQSEQEERRRRLEEERKRLQEEEGLKKLLAENQWRDTRNSREKGLALIQAAKNGNGVVLASLVAEGGVNVNAVDENNWTALHWASLNSHRGAVALLLENGAAINAITNDGRMPLHCAAWGAKKDVVALLFMYGATPKALGKHSLTPLHFAAWNGNKDVIDCLLANGNDINAKGSFNSTPLHYAVYGRDKHFVTILLAHGADPDAIESHSGCTALQLARKQGHDEVVNVLLAHARKGFN